MQIQPMKSVRILASKSVPQMGVPATYFPERARPRNGPAATRKTAIRVRPGHGQDQCQKPMRRRAKQPRVSIEKQHGVRVTEVVHENGIRLGWESTLVSQRGCGRPGWTSVAWWKQRNTCPEHDFHPCPPRRCVHLHGRCRTCHATRRAVRGARRVRRDLRHCAQRRSPSKINPALRARKAPAKRGR